MDYPKLILEKWNLTAKFNCLQAIYFYAPSALAVPMCGLALGLEWEVLVKLVAGRCHRMRCPTDEVTGLTE